MCSVLPSLPRVSSCVSSTRCAASRERSRWTRWASELVNATLCSTFSTPWQLLVVNVSLMSSALYWRTWQFNLHWRTSVGTGCPSSMSGCPATRRDISCLVSRPTTDWRVSMGRLRVCAPGSHHWTHSSVTCSLFCGSCVANVCTQASLPASASLQSPPQPPQRIVATKHSSLPMHMAMFWQRLPNVTLCR